jgi:hypothetical protein
MATAVKHCVMTKLIEDLEVKALKSPNKAVTVSVSIDDLLILIEYARQCEAVILMMDNDPRKAREIYKG